MKVTIGIPVYSDVKTEAFSGFMREFYLLGQRSMDTGDVFHLMTPMRCSWVDARNEIVKTAIETGSDYVYFIDDDMVLLQTQEEVERRDWRDSHFSKLLATDKDIVSALTFVRGHPCHPVIGKVDANTVGPDGKVKSVWVEEYEEGLVECDFIGLACCLIKTEVFKKMVKPWFWFSTSCGHGGCGEDVHFCNKAKMMGHKIWVDTRIKTGHLSLREMVDENWYRSHRPAN